MPSRDANGNLVYSQGEYEHFNFMGEPFCGFVEGIGYISSEVVVTPYSINKSETHFMWGISRLELLYEFYESDYYDVLEENTEELDFLDMLEKSSIAGGGTGLNIVGNNSVPTRGKFGGATKGTSTASIFFRYGLGLENKPLPSWIRNNTPKTLPLYPGGKDLAFIGKSNSWGGALGRSVPHAGASLTVIGVGFSVYNIHTSGYAPKVITQEASGWAGAWIGAKLGASGGAMIGGSIGAAIGTPVAGVGAVPAGGIGAAIGGFIGGIIGAIGGYWGGYTVSGEVYDGVTK